MSPAPYASYFANVPQSQRDIYVRFRQQHPFQTQLIDGIAWQYIDTETAPRSSTPLLILVGGLRVADAAFRAINALEATHRLIAPTYPPIHSIDQLADGLARLLDALHINQVDITGGSFGGLVAQVFVHRYPQHVRKMILSSTGLMSVEDVHLSKKTLRSLRWMPDVLARRITEHRLFHIINPPEDERAFWKAYLKELFANRLNKRDIISTIACMIDFGENFKAADDLTAWMGEVLIIGSEDDKTFQAGADNLRLERYPQANVHMFADAGHSPSMTRPQEYFSRVMDFLQY